MNRNQYENTMDYKKALKILNSFVPDRTSNLYHFMGRHL